MHKNHPSKSAQAESLQEKIILTGDEIISIGEKAELLVGGKNYNTALLSQISGIKIPHFRAISSVAFHQLLDETSVCASLVRDIVDKHYTAVDWTSQQVTEDYEFIPKFVRNVANDIRNEFEKNKEQTCIRLRTFITHVVEGFASSQEHIDQLRKRSILVQAAILSVKIPKTIEIEIKNAYQALCQLAEEQNTPVAVRSSAAGEDSRKKAFAGLQDTYLNISGEEEVLQAYHWDCASAYNLRSMIYRREAILDALMKSEATGDESHAVQAKHEWAIENTSLSVCMMRMINPVVSGTAFSADTATGCRGTIRNDLVSIDVSYGLGEAIVGGMVTPDKLYVYQKDDGSEAVLRFMGNKVVKIIYDENGGTKKIPVDERDVQLWALSPTQAEQIAKGVRAISTTYEGIIMDTEFCIDAKGNIWFVQARPETRWNEELQAAPTTIFMRRREVDPKAAESAEILLEGNGASRGAGQGTVKFLRSALELNKVLKGDILAAERTDPDMVPGMRVASAILADVGGDTSHAAITSRELGIPAVIGIQNPMGIKALDGLEVTVDGTQGRVYKGILPLYETGGEINVATIPKTKTKVGLVLADINQALFLSRLRDVPDFEVGLLRAEFMLGNIGAHPSALEAFDNGTLDSIIEKHSNELEVQLRKAVEEQLTSGVVHLDLQLKEYVGHISGNTETIATLQKQNIKCTAQELERNCAQIKHLEEQIDTLTNNALKYINTIKTSHNLSEHVSIIMGYKEQLNASKNDPSTTKKILLSLEKDTSDAAQSIYVKNVLQKIQELRSDVGIRCGITKQIEELNSIPIIIGQLIRASGHKSGKEHYIQTLSQGLALFAMAFYGKPIIYRTTDFKTNEYRNLLGGLLFEYFEDNPMLGYRGVARDIHPWELEAFKKARSAYGAKNLQLMLPFVRTIEQARTMHAYLKNTHNLESGKEGLQIILMSEIPSNAILAKQFIQEFDGFSIGSNDMTQMVLATDRDNSTLSHIYDEEDPAVVWSILVTIFTGQKYGKKVGFCGQGVANSPILRGLVAISGITSASVVPDTYYQTKQDFADIEALDIPIEQLGQWLTQKHTEKLQHIAKEYKKIPHEQMSTPKDIEQWYQNAMTKLHKQLQDALSKKQLDSIHMQIKELRSRLHKPIIYATWPWDEIVIDALHQAGFTSFNEQKDALMKQRQL